MKEEQETDTGAYQTDEEALNERDGWYAVIYSVANGEILKVDTVLNLTVDECFNFVAYQKDLSYLQNKG